MCYILCMSSSVLHCVGGAGGKYPPLAGVQGQRPREIFFPREMCHIFASFFVLPRFSCPLLGGFSAHGFLPMVFYFWLRN
jgi:hypothetical protein